jgi:hypothetical protein
MLGTGQVPGKYIKSYGRIKLRGSAEILRGQVYFSILKFREGYMSRAPSFVLTY